MKQFKSSMTKCCGEVGCARCCLEKIPKGVRKQLRLRVQSDMLKTPELAYKFVSQFMSGKEINNFGSASKQRKKVSWTYFAPAAMPELTEGFDLDDVERVDVCQVAFLEVFGINERFIRTARDDECKIS